MFRSPLVLLFGTLAWLGLSWPVTAVASPASELLERGRELLGDKQAARAEAELERCVALEPEMADCWWELGWARWLARDWSGVVEAWERVEALEPSRADLSRYLATARDNAAMQALLEQEAAGAPATFSSRVTEGDTIRIRAVGDVMLGTDFPEGYLPPHDGAHLLDPVAPWLKDAELTFANLEGPLCDGGRTRKCGEDAEPGSCYAFRSPTRYGRYLAQAGVDVVSTANNHSGDFGRLCREQTESTLDALDIAHTGRPGDVARLEVGSFRVAVIGFHTSAATHDVRDIDTARRLVGGLAQGHDLVVVSFHGGAEGTDALHVPHGTETFYGENRGNLRAFTHAVVEAGADLVIGHGPHVLRGMEIHQDRLIAYSLGNFATYGRFSLGGNLGVGAVLEVVLDEEGRFAGGRLLPTVQKGRGEPAPDEEARAIHLVRRLSREDFPRTGVQVAQDGTLAAPAP